ncbi:MAG: hypothetical protein HGB28_01625 [Oscillochloris sp.]|nr:hypothetical protein [Oscillochloris sp.]
MNPAETLVVTFFEHPCLAARGADGTIYVSVRDLCDAVGLRSHSQIRRLRVDEDLRDGLQTFRVVTPGGPQDQEFLILEFVPTWVGSVQRSRASVTVRERLRFLRLFAIRETYNAFARTAGLPEGESRAIEDLQDLERMDDAMISIAERQQVIETSQQKARSAWRELDTRVRALEEKVGGLISTSQRGHIYQLVHAWATARIMREPEQSRSEIFQACWGAIKTRYRIAKYEHLPATQYADCVQYITRSYQRLTGEELNLPEQRSFDLE